MSLLPPYDCYLSITEPHQFHDTMTGYELTDHANGSGLLPYATVLSTSHPSFVLKSTTLSFTLFFLSLLFNCYVLEHHAIP